MSFIKRNFGLIFVLLLAAAGAYFLLKPATPPAVVLTEVKQSPIVRVLALNGRVRATTTAAIKPKRAGTLVTVLAEEGQAVKAGDVLATVDGAVETSAVEQAKKALAARQAEVAQARRDLNRLAKLKKDGYATQSAVEQARASVTAGGADVARLAAAVTAAQGTLDKGELLAPFDGVVLDRPVDVGASVGTDTTVFTIATTDKTDIEAEADEIYAGVLHQDMPVTITASGLGGKALQGTVYWIAPNINTSTGGKTLRVAAKGLDALQTGMTVSLTVTVDEKDSALTLARDAVLTPQTNPAVLLFDAKTNTVNKTPITIVDWPAEKVEVLSGIKAGDKVAAAPRGVTDGAVITPSAPKKNAKADQ